MQLKPNRHYTMRGGGVVRVTSLAATDAIVLKTGKTKRTAIAFGEFDGAPMLWDAATGCHSAGANVRPSSRAARAFDIVRERRAPASRSSG